MSADRHPWRHQRNPGEHPDQSPAGAAMGRDYFGAYAPRNDTSSCLSLRAKRGNLAERERWPMDFELSDEKDQDAAGEQDRRVPWIVGSTRATPSCGRRETGKTGTRRIELQLLASYDARIRRPASSSISLTHAPCITSSCIVRPACRMRRVISCIVLTTSG
jgi:hypothetical protein